MSAVELVSDVLFGTSSALVGERFGGALGASEMPLRCHALPESREAAKDYLELIGRPKTSVIVHDDRIDLDWLENNGDESGIDIVLLPATMPSLKEEFFTNPRFRLFVDHIYVPERRHESPMLYTVGTTSRGLARLDAEPHGAQEQTHWVRDRQKRLHQLFGSTFVTDMEIVDALRGPGVRKIRLHGLGPDGTNIARCCHLFVAEHELGAKTDVIVHPRKVEPLEYAEIAAGEVTRGIVPLHVECAVFYALKELYRSRHEEVVFASHLYMALDSMQLAGNTGAEPFALPAKGLRVASHPSPKALADALFDEGAVYVRASSNADAALMVERGEADVCITTGSGCIEGGLKTLHNYGCPTMLFTVGASVNAATLVKYGLEAALLHEIPALGGAFATR